MANENSIIDIAGSGILQLVTFTLAGEEFGVDILLVREIIRPIEITAIPRSPEFVEGIINLRGKVIPIIDLRKRFTLKPQDKDTQTRIVVVELDSATVGFIVDAVSEVLRIPANTVEPPPAVISGVKGEYINGVGKLDDRLLILIDLNKVLSNREAEALAGLQTAA